MLRGIIKAINGRKQVKDEESKAEQTEAWLRSPYTQNMLAEQRMAEFLRNPSNLQPVSELQADLLEANEGLVIRVRTDKEDKPSRGERK